MVTEISSIISELNIICTQLEQQGTSQTELDRYYSSEYTRLLEVKHQKLLTKYHTNEEEVDASAQLFVDDPELKAVLNRFNQLKHTRAVSTGIYTHYLLNPA